MPRRGGSRYSPQDYEDLEMAEEMILQEGRGLTKFTKTCWDRCAEGHGTEKLSSGEKTCLVRCTKSILESTSFILERFIESQTKKGPNKQA
eukprot:TRINITY_DN14341_c0_g1_i1.p1 TRINITY_DN14341_c0_g1~~TRINITY_DN14341_c0_g1_i1.p1  ORF type:complete len:106 (-),score=12.11 TRINITY_DN14341_c0_g1_i1:305-577(-)